MAKMNLKTQAYNTIKQKIVQCEYAPGMDLSEEILTDELKISRTPIRDALSRLEQEGLIEIKPKRGITVTSLSIGEINMIFEIRILYEPYILKNYGLSLSEQELKKFYEIFSPDNTDSERFVNNDYYYELDASFHEMIIDACPNFYIRQQYKLIQTQSERFRYMTGNKANNRLEDTFQEHIGIIIACLQKDWDIASQKMIKHLEESKKATFQLVFTSLENNQVIF